ncbi:MAG: CotH kinase family protein [Candidatus Cloacimonetes bacterium]|nr:CotH kinase family protein [Candidatus Cloacimonadota bacterium]MCF7814614.1 CotH kinase family protein [Candidatus Cloacimonadota bacterium]MCF7868112.1 CotH kinase family protein [Candidatus Cloacimonadota bacterium]MCF7883578.1 CotH kinase family protein [Candidatus Cloacimonadota bacterium]
MRSRFLFFLLILFIAVLNCQDVKINEVMASNAITILDEDDDSPDWIELYNNSGVQVDLYNYGLSDDSSDLFKWLLPDISLQPDEYFLIFASDKDRRVGHWETVVDWGDEWTYFLGFGPVPDDWREIDFDDSDWFSGATGIGTDSDNATVIPAVPSLFMRRTFQIEDISNIDLSLMHIDYDDAFVAYINGIEVARANIGSPGIIPAFDDLANESINAAIYDGGAPKRIVIDDTDSIFVEGENVICIQTHNYHPYGDLAIIPFLSFGMIEEPTVPNGVNAIIDTLLAFPHANFKISSSGETIYLTNTNSTLVDSFVTTELPTDISMGLQPDGSNDIFFFNQPTPGTENSTVGYQDFSDPPIFSLDGGFFSGSQTIELSGANANETIYYTLDGSDPADTSFVYSQPVTIDTTHVVRARIIGPGSVPSPIITHSYFIDRDFSLLVISLATTPANFFDEDYGIYMLGGNASSNFPYHGANFWMDWERPIHIEMYNLNGSLKFSEDAGTKIHGRFSRGYPQKSLAIFFRNQYGNGTLNCQLFDDKPIDEFESILIRNSGNDFKSTHFRDAMVTNLMQDQNIDYQEFQPVIVYLNGDYWGIYNLREKVSEHFVASNNEGVDPDNIDRIEYRYKVLNGDSTAYHHLFTYLAEHDMSIPTNYDYIKTIVNVENLTKYLAANIYCNNSDWPRNNVSMWRERTDTGKWHWMLDDMDWSFAYPWVSVDDNTLWSVLSTEPSNLNPPEFTLIFRKMFENPNFINGFINCSMDYINTIFQSNELLQQISIIQSMYSTEMPSHIARWPYEDLMTMNDWFDNIDDMNEFASDRQGYAIMYMQDEFSVGNTVNVNIDLNNEAMGLLKLNFINLNDIPFNGMYFEDVPIKLTAIPYDGYEFDHWSGSSNSLNPVLEITPGSGLNLTANFQEIGGGNNSDIIINEINYHSSDNFDVGDWIEIYNRSNASIDLSGWQFKDEDDEHIYNFSTGFSIDGNSYYVLCQDIAAFQTHYSNVSNCTGNFDFGLSASGEEIRIFDADGNLVNNVIYDDEYPWPTEPDGTGSTLEVKNPNLNNAVPSNWAASSPYGTPGSPNENLGTDDIPELPQEITLYQNYPNPFNPTTNIKYYLPTDGKAELKIYNVKGQLIKSFCNEFQERGFHSINWNSLDKSGKKVASGIYFYQLDSANKSLSKKMLLLK